MTEKGAASRTLYLPEGAWYDLWTHEKHEGRREIVRQVDLATMPVYVRAGAVLPTAPVRQYTSENVDGPLTLTVFPGANGSRFVYEDDGETFDFRGGAFMRVEVHWDDAARNLTLQLASGSRMLKPIALEIKLVGSDESKKAVFAGKPLAIKL